MIYYVGVENWKIQSLPLARIKKIMKSEEFILQELEKDRQQKIAEEEGRAGAIVDASDKPAIKFMISGEAPVLMSKACELLIKDLSFRAWRHTERNRRRTLQRQDLHAAVGESEVYDFLIDIVPRVTSVTSQKVHHAPPPHGIPAGMGLGGSGHGGMAPPSIPHGMMQMHSGVHATFPATQTTRDDATLMQTMETHHLAQPTQQQAYQYDPAQQGTPAPLQHMSHPAHHLHHDHQHQQQQVQHQHATVGTSTLPPPQTTGQPGQLPPGSATLWNQ